MSSTTLFAGSSQCCCTRRLCRTVPANRRVVAQPFKPFSSHVSRNGRSLTQARAVIEKEGEGGTGVLDKPGKETIIPDSLGPITEDNFGATEAGGDKELGGGDYRLLLLDSETHTEPLVVTTITTVVPGKDEQFAKNCFMTSKQLGQALVTSALKEHAEFYCDQMRRKGCKASIEPDTTTL